MRYLFEANKIESVTTFKLNYEMYLDWINQFASGNGYALLPMSPHEYMSLYYKHVGIKY